jgi:hypothetical protein
MHKKGLLFTLTVLLGLAGSAYGEGNEQAVPVLLAGTTLPVKLFPKTSGDIEAEVARPTAIETVWDQIAAHYVGCRLSGGGEAHTAYRWHYKFDTLTCHGKPPVHIDALVVSAQDQRLGLATPAGMNAPAIVLVRTTATAG